MLKQIYLPQLAFAQKLADNCFKKTTKRVRIVMSSKKELSNWIESMLAKGFGKA